VLVYNREKSSGEKVLKYRRHHVVTVLITVFAVLLCLGVYGVGVQSGLEHKTYDARVRLSGTLGPGAARASGQVVVVAIDERSIIGEKPLLFIYDDIGQFLRRMDKYGVKTVGLDVILVHKQSDKLRNAAAALMADDGEKAKTRVGMTMEELGEKLDRSALEPIMDASQRMNIVQVVHGNLVPFYYGVSPFIKNMTIADASLTDGDLGGNDGVIRKQRLHSGARKDFASALYLLSTGRQYGGSQVYLNYALASAIPFYCLDDVMSGKVDRKAFAGKTVILGYISGYEDVHATPLVRDIVPLCSVRQKASPSSLAGGRIPGPLIHGIITETMLTGSSLKDAPPGLNIAILVVLAAMSLAAISLMRPLFAVITVFAIAAAFFVVNVILFAAGTYLHLFPQAVCPFVVVFLVYPYRYLVEERTRRKVQKVFGYYIDRNVLDRLLESGSEALLGGEARRICILFLDIRNFTELSTKRSAQEVVRFLNFFFGNTTEIIQKHAGFVNKFIGDGILAFFMTGENPCADAVSAAREILAETERLNDERQFGEFIGDWEVSVGIGIHYGEVILGNIGSERKMDFTIIGEHVNIASRIEGLTKEAGVALLVSSDVRAVAGEGFLWRDAGEFAVKGMDRSISLYTVGQT